MSEFAKTTVEKSLLNVGNASLNRLTEREREVLLHIGRGLANREIARPLHLGESTVKTHVKRS